MLLFQPRGWCIQHSGPFILHMVLLVLEAWYKWQMYHFPWKSALTLNQDIYIFNFQSSMWTLLDIYSGELKCSKSLLFKIPQNVVQRKILTYSAEESMSTEHSSVGDFCTALNRGGWIKLSLLKLCSLLTTRSPARSTSMIQHFLYNRFCSM